MRQTRTRILSLFLALMMCLSLLPMTALAADGDVIIDGGSVIGPTDTEYVTSSEVRADTSVAYIVTFDANGGKFSDGSTTKAFSTKKVGDENLVDGFPPDPIRDGYEFGGWYRETIGEYPSVFNYDYKKDTTVYAHWEKTNGDTSSLLITFDPNGGTCGVKTLPLVDGILKGPLPVPTKPGFTFEGWYRWYESSANPGRKIAAGEAFTAPETVIAVWSKTELKSVRIDFFANGGRISQLNGKQIPTLTPGEPPYDVDDNGWIDQNSGIGWTNTDANGILSRLPVAVRDGYTFDGWYKLADDSNFWDVVGSNYFTEVFTNPTGQKLTTSTVNAESATYVAKWVKAEKIFTVTFNLNGATGAAPEPQKVERGKTVDLPVLTASNANFLGWGYSTDGKTLTEWKAEYPVNSDLTLYAIWESKEDTYSFDNDDDAFANYKITDVYFDYLMGDSLTWKESIYKQFFEDDEGNEAKWGGSCFGMSAVYCMARGGTIDLSVFQSGAATLQALKTPRQSQNIQDLINFYMIAQTTGAASNAKNKYLRMTLTE